MQMYELAIYDGRQEPEVLFYIKKSGLLLLFVIIFFKSF